jgi:Spy/CpxP family protein refolding chaperone
MMQRLGFIPPVLAALALSACGSAADPRPVPTEQAPVVTPVKGTISTSAHGNAKHVLGAFSRVPLDAAQRAALEKIATDAEPLYAATHQARETLVEAVAVQVEHGAVDRKALEPQITELVTALKQEEEATRVPFLTLGASMSTDQKDSYGKAVHDVIHEERIARPYVRPVTWAKTLGLTAEQGAQIKAAALEADRLDLGLQPTTGPQAREPADPLALTKAAPLGRLIRFLERAVPVLTPAQRTAATQLVRDQSSNRAQTTNLQAL